MDAPPIQYARTSDGVSIAYSVAGDGPPLVVTPTSWDTIQFDIEDPFRDNFASALARHFRVVKYDRRGVGMSDRERSDFTIDADVHDLEAVVDAAGIEELALVGLFHLGPAAITYAARRPERISHLILYGTYARGGDLTRDEIKVSLVSMLRSHWGIASRTIVDMVAPGIAGETLDMMARHTRASVTADMAASLLEMAYATDVTSALASVRAPTLVLHREKDRAVSFRHGQMLAAGIGRARLVKLQGNVHFPWLGDSRSVLKEIEGFVLGTTPADDEPRGPSSATAIILFADIADSTGLTERLGDAAFREKARDLDDALRRTISSNGGTAIEGKLLGDGVLATFVSAKDAIDAALASETAAGARGLGLHIGLHAGDVIREENNVFGGAVNIAARISALAAPGEVLVSDIVRGLARTSAGASFEDCGERELKGVSEPVRVFAVRSGPVEYHGSA